MTLRDMPKSFLSSNCTFILRVALHYIGIPFKCRYLEQTS